MNPKITKRINIVPDNYHAKLVGKTDDSRQFFITTPFTPSHPNTKKNCEFIAVFIWDENGTYQESIIDNLGGREEMNDDERDRILKERIDQLGDITITTINVEAFKVVRYGLEFGLIYSCETFEDAGEMKLYEVVELHPGNYMAFGPPWDGSYDT